MTMRQPYDKNSAFLFYGKHDKKHELKAINLSNFFPTTAVTDPILALTSAIRSKEDPAQAAANIVGEFFRPYYGEQMLAGAIIDAARNKTKYGGQVYRETDPFITKVRKGAWHIGKTLVPGTITRATKRIIPAFRDEHPEYGRKLEPATEIFREASGLAMERFDFATGLFYKSRQTAANVYDARTVFTSPLFKNARLSADDILLMDAIYRSADQGKEVRLA